MPTKFDRLDLLQRLLRAPLEVTSVQTRVFQEKQAMSDEVVVTHRLLILRKGRMDYTVDGILHRLEAGQQFFVPAWSRRTWVTPRRSGGCRLLWCEFSSGALTVPPGLFRRRLDETERDVAAMEEMLQLAARAGKPVALRLEGELKALLSRFWPEVDAGERTTATPVVLHPAVARAVVWLERHYAEPDALEAFYRTVELSPNHFRLLFRRETGETVQAVLARLRLRRARYLVQETARPMKRIAAETGFADPLYFSNQYRKFWGRAATEDRAGGGVA